MIRISKITDYGIVALCEMSRADKGLSVSALAQRTGLPEPTLAKLLKACTRAGIVVSQRGAAGGYALARPAAAISIADIIAALDGPIALTDCIEGNQGDCNVEHLCSMRGNWDKLNRAVCDALRSVSLAEMALPFAPQKTERLKELA